MYRTLIQLFFVVLLTSGGQLLLKFGARDFRVPESTVHLPVEVLQNPYFLACGVVYAVDFLLYAHVLTRTRLSIAYPFIGLTYVLVVVGSAYFFGETVSLKTSLGVGLIVVGVSLVGLGLEGGPP